LDCEVFSQAEGSGRSIAHGSCQPADEELQAVAGFGMDLYEDREETEAAIAEWSEYDDLIPYCLVYGDDWSVSFTTGDANDSNCQLAADRLDGEIVRHEP
jgi:hypothetical protein